VDTMVVLKGIQHSGGGMMQLFVLLSHRPAQCRVNLVVEMFTDVVLISRKIPPFYQF